MVAPERKQSKFWNSRKGGPYRGARLGNKSASWISQITEWTKNMMYGQRAAGEHSI